MASQVLRFILHVSLVGLDNNGAWVGGAVVISAMSALHLCNND
jgi:hypothetical protein